MSIPKPFWIMRDHAKCSGCRRCEIACSLKHEGRIWPEASRVRIFMPFPGIEVAHLCAQCEDAPCIASCPVGAISNNPDTRGVEVDREKCISCGNCVEGCPGHVPTIHPTDNYALICDFCGGDPQCVKVCTEARFNCLYLAPRETSSQYKLFSQRPEEVAKNLATSMFGEKGKELI